MYVSAHLLSRLGRSKNADDRDSGQFRSFGKMRVLAQLGVISGWCGLVVIDAVQADTKDIHLDEVDESARRKSERKKQSSF